MTHVLFVCQDTQDTPLFSRIAAEIAPQVEQVGIVNYIRFGLKLVPPNVTGLVFGDYVNRQSINPADLKEELKAIENRYNVTREDLDRIILSDRIRSPIRGKRYYRKRPDARLVVAINQIKAWEELFQEQHPTHLFAMADGALLYRTLHLVAERLGIPVFVFYFVPLPGRITWAANEVYDLGALDLPLQAFTEEKIQTMRKYVDDFRGKQTSWMLRRKRPLRNKFRQLMEYLWIKASYDLRTENWAPLTLVEQFLLRKWRQPFEQKLYTQPQPDENYVFFPLHDPFDAQITVRAPEFIDQFAFVNELAAALPDNYMVYTKQHPMQLGLYDVNSLRQITQHPKIRLIAPNVPGLQLILGASAVVTINSTAGVEGIIHRKSVITMGQAFYSGRGLTVDVRNRKELPAILNDVLNQPEVGYSDEEVLRFLLNLEHISVLGNVYYYLDDNNDIKPPSKIIETISRTSVASDLAKSIMMVLTPTT